MEKITSGFKLSKIELMLFALLTLFLIMARGATLFQVSYAIDDYLYILDPMHYNEILANGRFGWVLITKILNLIGASPPLTNIFYTSLYISVCAWIGVIICRIWNISDKNILICGCVSSVLILHPYHAELYTFKICSIFVAISLLLSFMSLYLINNTCKSIIINSLILSFSLSIYQLTVNYLFIVSCFSIIIEASKQSCNGSISWKKLINDTYTVNRFITIAAGVILYLIFNNVILSILHINQSTRSKFISIDNITVRVIDVYQTLIKILFYAEPVMPIFIKLALIACGLIALMTGMFQLRNSSERVKSLFVIMLMYTLILLGVFGINILTGSIWWPTARSLSGISIVWSGIIAVLLINIEGHKYGKVVFGLIGVLLFGFIGINNHILTDQLRVNARDFRKASSIVARLENEKHFSFLRRIALVGEKWGFASPLTTVQGDMNISAFGASWAKVKILNEVSGYAFAEATQDEMTKAITYCNSAPKWPDPDSVQIDGELAIVCQ